MSNHKHSRTRHSNEGAALITSLVMLTVLTLLSISVMSTARLELTMAGNLQTTNNAFQLAESAADAYMAQVTSDIGCFGTSTAGTCNIVEEQVQKMKGTRSVTNRYIEEIPGCKGASGEGNSINGTIAFHFIAEASGTSNTRGGTATHSQGWQYCRPTS